MLRHRSFHDVGDLLPGVQKVKRDPARERVAAVLEPVRFDVAGDALCRHAGRWVGGGHV